MIVTEPFSLTFVHFVTLYTECVILLGVALVRTVIVIASILINDASIYNRIQLTLEVELAR